ncbi:MAG TPA: alpha/beta hydrolase [Noviherbaspirillum sp.]|uniref:RBBP9/YdeN family alpha/beta hydrolase n=1 Tax=Noviherbaspirillum sp. TaxID=1926288 RepID=UPI002D27A912|nr:alpha/beta hydrolase [Noviherbaspirillum sp.]HYD95091.1 alpha/beta hydrolase [Noviherbaspirillum sp.]
MSATVLILPGLFNSGEGHWQTIWERMLPNARRVQQRDWDAPERQDWVAALDAAVAAADGPVVLAAHSLGCATTAWWVQQHAAAPHAKKVKGALLVAPPDVERADFPAFVRGFAPMPRTPLPFKAIVVASSDDPWCALGTAQAWAAAWNAAFHHLGARGHINAASGLDDWRQGRDWLVELTG